jgi:type I restriction-modification system DNA methylase subunit
MVQKDNAKEIIAGLVARFAEQIDTYKHSDYNETQTRRDFIDPFFKALGWDIDNQNGYAEAYREVIHEDKIKISGATKAPDYSFRLAGGKRLFFVEAKKPSVAVKDDILPAYQIRRYGWSAKHPISIITDFEEFAIYDCTQKPNPNDKASVARIKYFTYEDYLNEFDFLWETFSKERVLKGSFDKYVLNDTNKKGTTTVDKEFLSSLDKWRTDLAVNISKQNLQLNEDELNFVVQQTIDRIIFLRIAEDRHIEPYGTLQNSVKQGDFFKNIYDIFRQADEKYNSGLFDLTKDKISKILVVENKILKKIINELYYPESPYEFSVLSVEILGSAYEQFLGKTILIDKSHRAKIEEKPEVRKAGGVYYTPQYIVDYIVKNTVGHLIEGKTPKEIDKIKIADPACGSGSFLIGAYQYLLDYHKNYYTENGTKIGKKDSPITPEGSLTSNEKKRILLNNIYGVDIDTNAVEVTKLSLLLKCMEGETETTIAQQYKLWQERILPTLDDNIKSGNSLIDTDFYDTKLDFGEDKKVKPFNWQNAFPNVFAKGGFDAIIGNPPYVRQELLGDFKDYFTKKYLVYDGVADLYTYFIERGIGLLKTDGLFGIIVANKWMRANYGEPLRRWLKKIPIKQIIDFKELPVFQGVTTYPCILICSNNKTIGNIEITNVKTLDFHSLDEYVNVNKITIPPVALDDNGWKLSSDQEQNIFKKIQEAGIPLGQYVNNKIFRGVVTGFNNAFIIDTETKDRLIKEDPKSSELIKPFLIGKDIKRYQPTTLNKYLIFTRRGIKIDTYPAIKNHLLQFKKQLTPKPKDFTGTKWEGRKPGPYKWYEIQDSVDYYEAFEKPKICWGNLCKEPPFNIIMEPFYINAPSVIMSSTDYYLLGLLNSSTLWYYLINIAAGRSGGYIEAKPIYVSQLPIKVIKPGNPTENTQKNEIIRNVEYLLQLNKEKQSATLQSQLDQIQSRIDYYENKINLAVYQLYALTEDEIKIIEDSIKK